MMTYEDILYEIKNGVATITINRPDKLNAFRGQTCEEMIHAFCGPAGITGRRHRPDRRRRPGVLHRRRPVVPRRALRRAGRDRPAAGGVAGVIRDVPKPVIAKVRGYAIGGGHVLALLCDLTIAAESANFGQIGPKVGSVDPGFGTAYMARVIGEKRAREIWYLCRQYEAAEAVQWGWPTRPCPTTSWTPRWSAGARRFWRRARPRWSGETLLQRRHRPHRRPFLPGAEGGQPVLRHRGIPGRGAGVSGKAQAEIPRLIHRGRAIDEYPSHKTAYKGRRLDFLSFSVTAGVRMVAGTTRRRKAAWPWEAPWALWSRAPKVGGPPPGP